MLIHPEKHLGSFLFLLFCNHRLPIWISDKESVCLAGDRVRSLGPEDPWGRKWKPIPVFLPGKFHGQRSLAGSSPWGRRRVRQDLGTTQQPQPLDGVAHYGSLIMLFLGSLVSLWTRDFIFQFWKSFWTVFLTYFFLLLSLYPFFIGIVLGLII